MITYEDLKELCISKAGAYETRPFGPFPICYKVGNRIFLEWFPDEDKVTLRCDPQLALVYRDSYPGLIIAGYHCPDRQKPYKNTVYLNCGLQEELIYNMIDHSYDEAVKRLTKKERMGLYQS